MANWGGPNWGGPSGGGPNDPGPFNPYAAPGHYGGYAPAFDYGVLATRGSRLGAKLLDGLLDIVCIIPGMAWFISQAMDNPSNPYFGADGEPNYEALALPIGSMLLPILLLSIYQWYLISTRGQTLGKRWMKIKIIKQDGSDVGFVSGVILREWVIALLGQLPYIGGMIGLVDICFIFSDDHQCLHDKIAKTKVVAVM